MTRKFVLFLLLVGLAHAKDRPGYIKGTYLGNGAVLDGTYTNAIRCGGGPGPYSCSGSTGFNSVAHYYVKTDDGTWLLETYREAAASHARRVLGIDPHHLTREKPNLLDDMKPGGQLLFRVEYHRKLVRTETCIYIPRADNPSKEDKFIGSFVPRVAPPVPAKPADNVKALRDSHKLPPNLEAQFCQSDTGK